MISGISDICQDLLKVTIKWTNAEPLKNDWFKVIHPGATVTTYHKVGGLKLRNLYFYNSRGQKFNFKLLAGSVLSGVSEGESFLISDDSRNPRCSLACGRCIAPTPTSVVCHIAFFSVCPCVFAWSSSRFISTKILFTIKIMVWEAEQTWNMEEYSSAQCTHLLVTGVWIKN